MKKILATLLIFAAASAELKLLVKFPTRSRPEQFFAQLDLYYAKLSGKVPYQFVISCDLDDPEMNNSEAIKKLDNYPNLTYYFGESKTKMEAINADIGKHLDFDVLLLASDDMTPVAENYDQIIVEEMEKNFPDLDGVLHFNDGVTGESLNTLAIMGKAYYQRFGYIYYPGYKSVACDVDLMLTANMLGKSKYLDQVIIRHDHPSQGHFKKDELFYRNESRELMRADKKTLHKRHIQNYNLKQDDVVNPILSSLDLFGAPKDGVKWSILILTLDSREAQFEALHKKLISQIETNRLHAQVEVLFFKDNKKHSVGEKRNKLVETARGEYISFVDDDDDVHSRYVKMLYDKLQYNPDCLSLEGVFSCRGKKQKFIHSVEYNKYFTRNNVHYRPPNHLNPIKKTISSQFKFPEINYREDTNWAMQICKSGLLKNEIKICTPYYFYNWDPDKTETQQHCKNKANLT